MDEPESHPPHAAASAFDDEARAGSSAEASTAPETLEAFMADISALEASAAGAGVSGRAGEICGEDELEERIGLGIDAERVGREGAGSRSAGARNGVGEGRHIACGRGGGRGRKRPLGSSVRAAQLSQLSASGAKLGRRLRGVVISRWRPERGKGDGRKGGDESQNPPIPSSDRWTGATGTGREGAEEGKDGEGAESGLDGSGTDTVGLGAGFAARIEAMGAKESGEEKGRGEAPLGSEMETRERVPLASAPLAPIAADHAPGSNASHPINEASALPAAGTAPCPARASPASPPKPDLPPLPSPRLTKREEMLREMHRSQLGAAFVFAGTTPPSMLSEPEVVPPKRPRRTLPPRVPPPPWKPDPWTDDEGSDRGGAPGTHGADRSHEDEERYTDERAWQGTGEHSHELASDAHEVERILCDPSGHGQEERSQYGYPGPGHEMRPKDDRPRPDREAWFGQDTSQPSCSSRDASRPGSEQRPQWGDVPRHTPCADVSFRGAPSAPVSHPPDPHAAATESSHRSVAMECPPPLPPRPFAPAPAPAPIPPTASAPAPAPIPPTAPVRAPTGSDNLSRAEEIRRAIETAQAVAQRLVQQRTVEDESGR